MKKVTILGLYNSLATTIFGPMDILNQAGRLYNRVGNSPPTPLFDISIASADGQPIRCTNNVFVQPHCSIERIQQTDLIVIASATYYEDISSFREVFVRLTGLRPKEYQQRFAAYSVKHILQ